MHLHLFPKYIYKHIVKEQVKSFFNLIRKLSHYAFLPFSIFSDFNQDGKPDNITFMVKRIKVHTMDALKDRQYRFPNNYGVEKFLELFSGKFLNLKNNTPSFISLKLHHILLLTRRIEQIISTLLKHT